MVYYLHDSSYPTVTLKKSHCETEQDYVEYLAEKTIWSMPKDEILRYLIDIKINPTNIDLMPLTTIEREKLLNCINHHIKNIHFTIEKQFNLTFYSIIGAKTIKHILCEALDKVDDHDHSKFKINLVSRNTPTYCITCETTDKSGGMAYIKTIFNHIELRLKDYNEEHYRFNHNDIITNCNDNF